MARTARKLGESGIYHVMLRGINQSELFYDSDDKQAFLERLARFKLKDSYKLYAYALMGNHVHLLIAEGTDKLSMIMKKIAVSYSYWFNAKYLRSGYLFEGRFKSEPVDDDSYFLTVFKYIHLNPVKVGSGIDSWTSFDEYMDNPKLVDTDFVLDMFADNKEDAQGLLREFLEVPLADDAGILGADKPNALADEVAIEKIKAISGLETCDKLADLDKVSRDRILHQLKREGFTIRQISRLTRINRGIIQKAKAYD